MVVILIQLHSQKEILDPRVDVAVTGLPKDMELELL
jgi:hypothetical protein